MELDFSEIRQLSAELGKLPGEAGKYVPKALEVTARNIKDDWAKSVASRSGRTKHLASAVSYDRTSSARAGASEIEFEIGYDRSKPGVIGGQAKIGTWIEFGTRFNGPGLHGQKALDKNRDDYVKGLEKAIEDSLRDAGL